jgi:hypothetical protein
MNPVILLSNLVETERGIPPKISQYVEIPSASAMTPMTAWILDAHLQLHILKIAQDLSSSTNPPPPSWQTRIVVTFEWVMAFGVGTSRKYPQHK